MTALRTGTTFALGLIAAAMLSGCHSTKRALGLEKTVPDEFAVLNRGPLVMPPDYTLRPPVPGAERPQELPAVEQARTAVFGRAKIEQLRARGMSMGEIALLAHAGTAETPPDVRTSLEHETSMFASEDKQFTHKLLDWKDENASQGVAIDPVKEKKRLAQNQAAGKKANEGNVPIIGGAPEHHKFLGIF
jgi:hypothetical protein